MMGFLHRLFGGGADPLPKPPDLPRPPAERPAPPADLCARLGASAPEVAFLADPRAPHYETRFLKKRGGGRRRIDAPKIRLKRLQRTILEKVLVPNALHEAAHGYREGRSIVSAAAPHAGKNVLVTADIESFFPTIRAHRVRGLFKRLGFDAEAARVLMRLTTWKGRLPQGAPTSPAISNLVCRRLDARLAGLAKRAGAAYTRYADDMAFSGDRSFRVALRWFLPALRKIVAAEGFRLPMRNIAVRGAGGRQKFVGIVVNAFPNVPRLERRRLRAAIHNARKGSLAPEDRVRLEGKVAWVKSVNPLAGARLSKALREVPVG